jgi:hypothetical protein
MPSSGYLNARREDRRRPRCAKSFRTGLFRRPSKSGLRSGLAARQDDRRQVHLLNGSTASISLVLREPTIYSRAAKVLVPHKSTMVRLTRPTGTRHIIKEAQLCVTAKSADRCSLRASWRSVVRLPRHINLRCDVDVCSDLMQGVCIRKQPCETAPPIEPGLFLAVIVNDARLFA